MLPDRRTVVIGLLSYTAWGLFPIYWRLVQGISAGEMLAHRFVWSFIFYLAVWWFVRARQAKAKWQWPPAREWILSGIGGIVLSLNWMLFIYAVLNHKTLEASLAYFLNPLLNVAVGVLFFRETLPWGMRIAISLAGIGIASQLVGQAEFPWIAVSLAGTFCAYGVVKKLTRVESNLGLVMESSLMFLPALVAAIVLRQHSSVEHLQPVHWLFLAGAGVVTGVPLVLFAYAAQRLPYSLLGVMQFVAPTLQFLVGWLMFGEQPTVSRMIAFSLVWAGVAFFLADRVVRLRRTIEVEETIAEIKAAER